MSARAWMRWAGCLLLVLSVHAGALMWLERAKPIAASASQDPVMLDLVQEPATATPKAAEPAPVEAKPQAETAPVNAQQSSVEPPPTETPPKPEPQVEMAARQPSDALPETAEAEMPLPPPPVRPALPRPPHDMPRRIPLPRPSPAVAPPSVVAPPHAPTGAATAEAPPDQAPATWQARLLAHLARFKRFPSAAQRRGEHGTVLMRFTMIRDGSVVAMSVVRSSGFADLDEAAQAWMNRAQPLPAFPPEMVAQQIELVVPLRFILD